MILPAVVALTTTAIPTSMILQDNCVFNNATGTCITDGITTSGEKVLATDFLTSYRSHIYTSANNHDDDVHPQFFPGGIAHTYLDKVLSTNTLIYDGDVTSVSGYMRVGSSGGSITNSQAISHTFTVSIQLTANLMSDIGESAKRTLGIQISFAYAHGRTSTIAYQEAITPYSEARLVFKPRLLKIWGRVHKNRNLAGGGVFNRVEDYEIISQIEVDGRADGAFSLEYRGVDVSDVDHHHKSFYSLPHKDLPMWDATTHWGVKSAHHCGELAIRHDKNLAVYRPECMGCWLKDVDWKNGITLGGDGHYIGAYDVAHSDREDTWDGNRVNEWKREGYCDIIHHGDDGHFWCKRYPDTPGAILMFRYNS